MNSHTVFFTTSEYMPQIDRNSIQLVITSPPYWDLKDYGAEGQIGYREDYKTYLGRLRHVWKESYCVLRNDGTAVINVNTKSCNKELVLLPGDIIHQMRDIGFRLKDIHYWHKSSGIPRSKNFGDHFEYFLIFSKSESMKVNNQSLFDYKLKPTSPGTNIWNINKRFGSIGKKSMIHPAIFPVEYIERMIRIFTEESDYVLDPFLGSGTTLIAAIRTGRVCYGYELNERDYRSLIEYRLQEFGIQPDVVQFIQP